MVEFLFDPTMPIESRAWSFKVYLYPSVYSSFVPFTMKAALDGSYATWLTQDLWELQGQPICSHSEVYVNGKCSSCP